MLLRAALWHHLRQPLRQGRMRWRNPLPIRSANHVCFFLGVWKSFSHYNLVVSNASTNQHIVVLCRACWKTFQSDVIRLSLNKGKIFLYSYQIYWDSAVHEHKFHLCFYISTWKLEILNTSLNRVVAVSIWINLSLAPYRKKIGFMFMFMCTLVTC